MTDWRCQERDGERLRRASVKAAYNRRVAAGDWATRSLWRDIGMAMEMDRKRLPAARFARRAMGKAIGAAIAAIAAGGCKSPDQTASVLATLERGRAEGHLTVTTSGAVGVGQKTTLWAGAEGTTVAFDGSVNFAPAPPAGGQLPPAGGSAETAP